MLVKLVASSGRRLVLSLQHTRHYRFRVFLRVHECTKFCFSNHLMESFRVWWSSLCPPFLIGSLLNNKFDCEKEGIYNTKTTWTIRSYSICREHHSLRKHKSEAIEHWWTLSRRFDFSRKISSTYGFSCLLTLDKCAHWSCQHVQSFAFLSVDCVIVCRVF